MDKYERGSHVVDVRITPTGVNIDSIFNERDASRDPETVTDSFKSVEEAKNKLESLRSLYHQFSTGYGLLALGDAAIAVGGSVKAVGDFMNGEDFGGDLLRVLGVVGIGILAVAADSVADINERRTGNKLATLKEAEELGADHFHEIYPLN